MAKNSPLVGHFPGRTPALDKQNTYGLRGSNGTPSGQKPALILKMSALPAMNVPRIKLALRMLWKMVHESVHFKRKALEGGTGRGRISLSGGTLRANDA
jgi:hypothetical protein